MTPPDLPETAPEPKPSSAAPPSAAAADTTPAKTKAAAKPAPEPATLEPANLVTFTLDVTTGAVVSVEKIESGGARRALSDEDAQQLAGTARETIEGIVERAFEAGIACVLGSDADDAEETDDDAPLTRLLLEPLIDRSAARRLMRREVLDRAALASLIRHSRGTEH